MQSIGLVPKRGKEPKTSKTRKAIDFNAFSVLHVPTRLYRHTWNRVMASNLKRRHQTWYARVGVDPKYRNVIGRTETVRSLGTRDRRVAERLKYAVIADIKAEHERLIREAGTPMHDPVWLTKIARELRGQVTAGTLDSDTAGELLDTMREKHYAAQGVDPETLSKSDVAPYVRQASRMVADPLYKTLKESIGDYLTIIEDKIQPSTWSHKKKRLDEFAAWTGGVAVSAIDRRLASRYVTDVLARNGLSSNSNKHILTELGSFFRWLIQRGRYEQANPFADQSDVFKESSRGSSSKGYRAWRPEELKALFEYLSGQPEGSMKHKAHDVAMIALYSGMRLAEICSMKVDDVNLEDGFMFVSAGKNQNSVRQVPIHSEILALITKLTRGSTDGYLITDLNEGGEDSKRSHGLGNRFSEYKKALFPKAGRTLAFHGLRTTFITAAETASIPESTVKLLVGHARQSMSYGHYSKGPHFDVLTAAMEKVKIDL